MLSIRLPPAEKGSVSVIALAVNNSDNEVDRVPPDTVPTVVSSKAAWMNSENPGVSMLTRQSSIPNGTSTRPSHRSMINCVEPLVSMESSGLQPAI